MVFAAGLGTRLGPLTDALPKPVVPVVNRPLCAYGLDTLVDAGATHVVLNTHHLAGRVEAALASYDRAPLAFAHEARLLGTGGGVKNAVAVQSRALGRELAEDDVFVAFNGDISFAPDLEGAIALHRRSGAMATMVVREVPDAARFGAIEVDDEGRVRRMLGSPDGSLRACMFTGVHVLSARAIAALPEEGCIVRQGYVRWLAAGETISASVDAAPWRDLGTPREYLGAHLDLLRGEIVRPGFDARAAAIDRSAGIDPKARLSETCVGARARIEAGVVLERCVVWPETIVRASACDAVLAGEEIVDAR